MGQSVFAAGHDALVNWLAQQQALKEHQDALTRQATLDQNNEAYRQAQLGLRTRQEQRLEQSAAAQEADRQAQIAAGNAKSAELTKLYQEWSMLPPGPQRDALGVSILAAGGHQPSVTPSEKHVAVIDPRNGKVVNTLTLGPNTQVISQPAPEKPPAGTVEDPTLPTGVQGYLDELRAKYPADQNAAMSELARHAGEQRAKHPHLNLGKAAAYLKKLYPTSTNILDQLSNTGVSGLEPSHAVMPPASGLEPSHAVMPPASAPPAAASGGGSGTPYKGEVRYGAGGQPFGSLDGKTALPLASDGHGGWVIQ